MFAITFPDIDPVALELGPIVIRWYALAYIVSVILGWRYAVWLAARTPGAPSKDQLGDFASWAILGILLGGRLGSVLFYNLPYYLENPLEVLAVWKGGMSFHGGMLGMAAAILLYARSQGMSPFALGDLVAAAGPIGLFLGRIANFINGELWGRPADVPWAVIFPTPAAGGIPRHPSQLYEALAEGFILFIVLFLLARRESVRGRHGFIAGAFLVGYGIARIACEFFREPDIQIGYLAGGITMGQLLSLPMIAVGVWIAGRSRPIAA